MARWVEDILADYRDGSATSEDLEKLQALLLHEPTARQVYREANELSLLLETVSTTNTEEDQDQFPQAPQTTVRQFNYGWAAAAALALAAIAWGMSFTKPEPLARLTASHQAEFSGSALRSDSQFNQGTLTLSKGIAHIEMQNGVEMILEYSCELELIDQKTVKLHRGKMRVHCPMEARGFEVLAPGGNRIVDLGTEFGVSADPSGELDLHVFDGFVELSASHHPTKKIEAGKAVGISSNKDFVEGDADDALFASIASMSQKRWEAHHQDMLKRDDLLLYYDFAEVGSSASAMETNRASDDAHGTIHGATRVAGRVPGKGGLLFEQPGDRLAFELDPSKPSNNFTIAMWLKVDRFEHRHSILLNSNGWDSGDIHFHILRDGNLRSDIHGRRPFQSGTGTVTHGDWQFVAVSWDLDSGNTRFFCDGKSYYPKKRKLNNREIGNTKPSFGTCQIGSWGEPTIHHSTRDFKGRIDEVMVFSRNLTESEIKALYEASKP